MTDTPDSPTLAPCPFCGGPATRLEGKYDHGGTYNETGCDNVGCQVLPSALRLNQEQADAAWNRRADILPAPAAVRVKALVWEPSSREGSAFAQGVGAAYAVDTDHDCVVSMTHDGTQVVRSKHDTMEAAKRHCQEKETARILAALSPAPAPEWEGLVEALRRIVNDLPEFDYVQRHPDNPTDFEQPGSPYDRGKHDEHERLAQIARAALAAYEERGDG